MHDAVRQYVRQHLPPGYGSVLEVGSLDINGGVRDLLDPKAEYVGVDVQRGPGVDVVVDFTTYQHPEPVDVVLCLEVLEHTPEWPEIVASAARNLEDGGTLVLTCATVVDMGTHMVARARHSAHSSGSFEPGEFYENVPKAALDAELEKHFLLSASEVLGLDLRAWAMRGNGHG